MTVPEEQLREVGGYRLLRRIGAGGMGSVYEAVDAEGHRVALKLLHPHIGTDPQARRRLAREVTLLHRVRDAGVARVLDAEVEDAEAFVVTELVDGPTLEEDVVADGPFSPEELANLAHGLADALQAIHDVGVVHRDLKPGNVMMSEHGPVLIDFGIAQVADDARLTQSGMVTGTPGYLDPEVIAGAELSPVCDWWGWAAVLLFAATGRPPFGRGPTGAVLARVATGRADTDGLDDVPARALRAALNPDPTRRLDPDGLLAVLDGTWDDAALTQVIGMGAGGQAKMSAGAVGAAAGAAGAVADVVPAIGAMSRGDREDQGRTPGEGGPGAADSGVGAVAMRAGPATQAVSGGPDTQRFPDGPATQAVSGGPDTQRFPDGPATRALPTAAAARWLGDEPATRALPGVRASGGVAPPPPSQGAAAAGHSPSNRWAEDGSARSAGDDSTRVFPPVPRDGGDAAPTYPVQAPHSYPAQPTQMLPRDVRSAAPPTYPTRPAPMHPEQPTRVDGLVPYAQPRPTAPAEWPGSDARWPAAAVPRPGVQLGSPGDSGLPGEPYPAGLEPAPRWVVPPRHRTLTVASVGLGLSAAAASFPGVFLVIVSVLLLLTGTAGWAGRSRRAARLRRGRRPGDDAKMVAGLPWHLLRGAVSVLPGAVLGSLAGGAAWWVGDAAALTPDPAVADAVALWGAGLLALAVAWLTPTSLVAREGARAIVDVLTPTRGFRTLLVVLVLGVAAVVALQLTLGAPPTPVWSPLTEPTLPAL